MSMKIDGRKIAKKINYNTAYKIKNYKYYQKATSQDGKNHFMPTLVTVLVGDNPASRMYVRMKQRKAKELGIKASNVTLSANISQDFLNKLLDSLSRNSKFNAILLQLPLPKQLNAHESAEHIAPEKDVDGVNPVNIGRLASGVNRSQRYYPMACTPRGIMTMIYRGKEWRSNGLEATVVGRSDIVGRPMAYMLINSGAEVKVLNSHAYQAKMDKALEQSNLIVSATGHGNLITSDEINSGAVLIDAGIDHDRNGHLIGDISPKAKQKSLGYTPVPGGVGPMTIATLMRQTYELAIHQAS